MNQIKFAVTDFGDVMIVPDRLIESESIFFLDTSRLNRGYLRPLFSHELAKTGDSDKFQFLCEWSIEVVNEKAHGAIYGATGVA